MSQPRIVIAGREIGPGLPCWVIAEAGVNHNGSLDLALKLVRKAALCDADAVKWQKRSPALHARPGVMRESCAFPEGDLVTELQHREALEFGAVEWAMVQGEAARQGIVCFASAWDLPSVEFMAEHRPPVWKVASASLTDLELLAATRDAARADGAAVILSTGMSSVEQIDAAVGVLGKRQLALLHCVSTYPASFADCNLRAMRALADRYDVPVGWSGHEPGISVSAAAVAVGACIVERHLTLDRGMRGSDHGASLEGVGLQKLVRDIRAVEAALGDGEKRVMPAELPVIKRLRRV